MKINALTGSRAIAAIMVVILHYGSSLFPFNQFGKLFTSGNLSVSYFFVLSGFVLFISQSKVRYFTFLRNRVVRIAPAYFTALLLTILFIHTFYSFDADFPEQLISTLLFVQAYIPGCVLTLNSPAWSVSVEMTFYVLFPLLLTITGRRKLFIVVTVVAYLITQSIHLYYCNSIGPLTGSGIYFNPAMHMNEFMTGIAGAMLYKDYYTHFKSRLLSPILLFVVIALIIFRPDYVSYNVGLIAPVFMLLILSIAVNDVRWLSGRLPVFLGEISYGIYIYQFPVYKYLQLMNRLYYHLSPQAIFYLSLAALLLIASISYYLIEKPVIRLFKKSRAETIPYVADAKNGIRA